MTNGWSLPILLKGLHDEIEASLKRIREALPHPVAKGDASEHVWLQLLQTYLPERYCVERAFIVDSRGNFSQQIDIVIHDRQYSPIVFKVQGELVVPAESVYAVLEAKQSLNAHFVEYAQAKVASVRALHRTSLPIPHAGGTHAAKPLPVILGGIVTFESDWTPAMGKPLLDALATTDDLKRLDIGCIAAHGMFSRGEKSTFALDPGRKPATAFLFELITRLQTLGTVPMIDLRAYAAWLDASPPDGHAN